MDYKEQLTQPEWREKRLTIFERDGNKCTECHNINNLHCHHKYYCKGVMAWEYKDEALITLCGDCHQELHDTTRVQVFKKWEQVRKLILPEARKRIELEQKRLKKIKYEKKYKELIIERRTKDLQRKIDWIVSNRVKLLEHGTQRVYDLKQNIIRLDKAIQDLINYNKMDK